MKILFFSDIHGITDNLHFIEEKVNELNIDKIVCLGDLYYAGPTYNDDHNVDGNSVLAFLSQYKNRLICMRGNCDSEVDIKISDFPICEKISMINVDGIDIYLTHGHEYNIDKKEKLAEGSVLIYGHKHTPCIEKDNNIICICVGSISLPKNKSNPSYAIYENKTVTLYDIYDDVIDSISID